MLTSLLVYRVCRSEAFQKSDHLDLKHLQELIVSESLQFYKNITEDSKLFTNKISDQLADLDWIELKKSISLSDSEWLEYADSLNFLKTKKNDTLSDNIKDSPKNLNIVDGDLSYNTNLNVIKSSDKEIGHDDALTNQSNTQNRLIVASKKIVPSDSLVLSVNKSTDVDERYPHLTNDQDYNLLQKMLSEAKSENLLGLPSLPNSKIHLRRAVTLYKNCQPKITKLIGLRTLSSIEKTHLQILQQEVSKQIYWGTKLSTL